jgi:hypothetical protein
MPPRSALPTRLAGEVCSDAPTQQGDINAPVINSTVSAGQSITSQRIDATLTVSERGDLECLLRELRDTLEALDGIVHPEDYADMDLTEQGVEAQAKATHVSRGLVVHGLGVMQGLMLGIGAVWPSHPAGIAAAHAGKAIGAFLDHIGNAAA